MKRITSVVLACVVAGCATQQPQQAVSQLDSQSERYNTQNCRAARQLAGSYDDNVSGRMGLGLGLGLLLGPFGLPFAVMADASQAEKRNLVLAELKKHCEGPLTAAERSAIEGEKNGIAPAAKSDLQVKLQILDDLKMKGLMSESDYVARKVKLTE